MQGGVLSRANPNLILSSKSLVVRKCWWNERANFGVQQRASMVTKYTRSHVNQQHPLMSIGQVQHLDLDPTPYTPHFYSIIQTCTPQLLYPKIFPPIFTQDILLEVLNCSRLTKDWPDNSPPKAINLNQGFNFEQDVWVPRILNVLHYPNMSLRSSMPNFMPWITSLLSQLLKCLEINCIRS